MAKAHRPHSAASLDFERLNEYNKDAIDVISSLLRNTLAEFSPDNQELTLSESLTAEQCEYILDRCYQTLNGEHALLAVQALPAEKIEALYASGYEAYLAQDYLNAKMYFALITLHQPLDYRYPMALASALQHEGDYLDSLNFFLYAALLHTNDPGLLYRIGECLVALQEYDAAQETLDTALALCRHSQAYPEIAKQAHVLLQELNPPPNA